MLYSRKGLEEDTIGPRESYLYPRATIRVPEPPPLPYCELECLYKVMVHVRFSFRLGHRLCREVEPWGGSRVQGGYLV